MRKQPCPPCLSRISDTSTLKRLRRAHLRARGSDPSPRKRLHKAYQRLTYNKASLRIRLHRPQLRLRYKSSVRRRLHHPCAGPCYRGLLTTRWRPRRMRMELFPPRGGVCRRRRCPGGGYDCVRPALMYDGALFIDFAT